MLSVFPGRTYNDRVFNDQPYNGFGGHQIKDGGAPNTITKYIPGPSISASSKSNSNYMVAVLVSVIVVIIIVVVIHGVYKHFRKSSPGYVATTAGHHQLQQGTVITPLPSSEFNGPVSWTTYSQPSLVNSARSSSLWTNNNNVVVQPLNHHSYENSRSVNISRQNSELSTHDGSGFSNDTFESLPLSKQKYCIFR